MGFLRRNLYNPNLIEIPDWSKICTGHIFPEEEIFIEECHKKSSKNFFVNIEDLLDQDFEILKSLSRFRIDNPGESCTIKELERIFIESIYDGQKEYGMQIYFHLKKYYNSLDWKFKEIEDKDLVEYIISMKEDFKKYIKNDFYQEVYEDGKIVIKHDVINKVKPVDFYLDGMFVNREEIAKIRQKRLELKRVEDK